MKLALNNKNRSHVRSMYAIEQLKVTRVAISRTTIGQGNITSIWRKTTLVCIVLYCTLTVPLSRRFQVEE